MNFNLFRMEFNLFKNFIKVRSNISCKIILKKATFITSGKQIEKMQMKKNEKPSYKNFFFYKNKEKKMHFIWRKKILY